jgi:hypothetical protein
MAYSMVATRDNETITKTRESAMIVLASARVWQSEGWQVTITDADGNVFDTSGFADMFSREHCWEWEDRSAAQPVASIEPNIEEAVATPAVDEPDFESSDAWEVADAASWEIEGAAADEDELSTA